ncbi:MAG TPA: PfkB family carbohydrate kinase [Chitinophagaceae bacterium]|nr:PfkB family carbohydrate kinase [Chitinophagaceae bacterium]
MTECEELFNDFNSLKIGVIGDVMLDTYIWGKVDRISPEAPVPIVSLHHREQRIGGAGNVALNCSSLGAKVFMLGVIGDDDEAAQLEQLLKENLIDTTGLIKSTRRTTTNKTRIISRNQQMLRFDAEVTDDLNKDEETALLKQISNFIEHEDPNILIFEDYNKGVLTEKVIEETIALCRASGVITAADPKRKNFFNYKNVDVFKPNMKEVQEGLNLLFETNDIYQLRNIHEQLQKQLQHKVSLITLSEKGIFYQQLGNAAIIPSHLRNVADVSGAGDTVIAVAAMVYAATKNAHLMAEIANIAGGLVCEEVGTAAVDREKLLRECELLLS